ncbi:MAG TPA: glycosyltransferase [Candidatus Eisenbacteria bacterium]
MRTVHLDTGREWRGGQAQVLLLLEGLRTRGHECRLLAPRGPLLERARAAGIVAAPWRPRAEWDPGAALAAFAALRSPRADLAHCHSAHAHVPGVAAARLAGVAVVVSRRVDFAVARNPASALKYRMPVDRYLCISRGVIEAMAEGGVPRSKLALVPSGVKLPSAAPAPTSGAGAAAPGAGASLRAAIGAPPDAIVIGTVAALAPHKNHADLARAAALVVRERPDVHFAWIGEGECRPALERQLASLGLERRVHLLGFRADALELLGQFTVFALASYLEGLCTSLLDAEASGVPVVATAVGGIPEVVEHGSTGLLVPARDPQALAAALLQVLRDPEGARGRAAHARETVRAFGADAMVERTLQEYDAVLHERARRG